MLSSILRDIKNDLCRPDRLIPALSSGFVVGLIIIIIQLSLASLIFSGPLGGFAPAAAGLTLFGGFSMCLVVAFGSSLPSSIALPEDAPAAILASVAAGIATSLANIVEPRGMFVTVGAAMAISTFASGLLFCIVGRFRLGNLVRYMPYPVVAGFMAGIGWLLIQGSFSIILGIPLHFDTLSQLLRFDNILLLLPAVLLTLTLLFALNRWGNVYVLPGTLIAAIFAFLLYLFITGTSLEAAEKAGLLLGGIPKSRMLWPVFSMDDFRLIHWHALFLQIPQLCTIPLVSVLSFLLITSGLETASKKDIDLRREFYLNGLVNLVAGPAGSHTGYTALSFSLLGPRTGSNSRLVGISAALFTGCATFFGASALGFFPRFILGGMILFLGIATFLEWAIETRKKVTSIEYALILSILLAIGFFGFLKGVGFGLMMASVVFVIKYSQLPVIVQNRDGRLISSTRQRSIPDQHLLRVYGRDIHILGISGYLFFGSANTLSQQLADRFNAVDGRPPSFIILDFAQVDGFDSSAINCFIRMLQRAGDAECRLVFAGASPDFLLQLQKTLREDKVGAEFYPDLDRALEWCEDAILTRQLSTLQNGDTEGHRDQLFDQVVDDLLNHLADIERFENLVEEIRPYLQYVNIPSGKVLLRQGEISRGIWMLLDGQAEEIMRHEGEKRRRLRTLSPGCMAGELSEMPGMGATGNIVALVDCTFALLGKDAFDRLQTDDPPTALSFYAFYATELASRLAVAIR